MTTYQMTSGPSAWLKMIRRLVQTPTFIVMGGKWAENGTDLLPIFPTIHLKLRRSWNPADKAIAQFTVNIQIQ